MFEERAEKERAEKARKTLEDKKKPTDTWMQDYTLDQRKEKFFEFCEKFDKREDDLLRDDFQIFSHRLHWHEHPYVEFFQGKETSSFDKIWFTMAFSFSNEHWLTFKTLFHSSISYSHNGAVGPVIPALLIKISILSLEVI